MAAYGFARYFGLIAVEQLVNTIRVTGIPADIMARDIAKVYKTSRINTYMFSEMGANHFAFPKFFAIEVVYVLNDLLKQTQRNTAKATIRKIIKLLMEETWLVDTQKPPAQGILDFTQLSRLKWTPKDYQMVFLKEYSFGVPQLHLDGYLLAAKPGSGKTFMDIAVGVCLGAKAAVKIILSPKNALRLVWHATISDPEKTAFKIPPSAWYSDQSGDPPPDTEWCVFHYEALSRAYALGKRLSEAGVPFVVIVDESHNFNEMSSQRSNDLISLCRLPMAHNHIWASGSPIKALGSEAIPLLSSIDPMFTVDVGIRFKKIFGGDANRADEILRHRLSRVMFKLAADVVVSDKPIIIQKKIKLRDSNRFTTPAVREEMQKFVSERLAFYQKDMDRHKTLFQKCLEIYKKSLKSRAEMVEFDTYEKYIREISKNYDARVHGDMVKFCRALEKNKIMPRLPGDLRKQFKDSQSVVKYVSLKVQGEALGHILGKRRAECASELAKHCGLEDIIEDAAAKTIVFASYVSTVTDAVTYLESKGLAPKAVYADTNNMLKEIVDEFDKDETVNPLSATYKSLSTAVPLIMANTIVMLDKPVRQYLWEQTVARCARLGQTKQVYVYEILLDTGTVGNVSTRADEIISWSRAQVASIIGEEFSGNDLEVVVENFSDWTDKTAKRATSVQATPSALGWALEAMKGWFRK